MATLAEVRGRVRRLLEDTDAVTPLWSDAELGEWLGTAAREYGLRRPREGTVGVAAVAGQSVYALPGEVRRVLRVESPPGWPVPRRAAGAGAGPGLAQSWAFFGGALEFGTPPGGAIVARFRGLYPWPTVDGPTVDGATVELPDEGVDVVVLGAALLALGRREVAAAKRRGGQAGVGLALEVLRRMYAESLARCRVARGGTVGE